MGIGVTTSKHEGKEPLWPDELSVGRVKYPYRWHFNVKHILDQQEWKRNSISLRGLNIQFFSGINPIFDKNLVRALTDLAEKKWNLNFNIKI